MCCCHALASTHYGTIDNYCHQQQCYNMTTNAMTNITLNTVNNNTMGDNNVNLPQQPLQGQFNPTAQQKQHQQHQQQPNHTPVTLDQYQVTNFSPFPQNFHETIKEVTQLRLASQQPLNVDYYYHPDYQNSYYTGDIQQLPPVQTPLAMK